MKHELCMLNKRNPSMTQNYVSKYFSSYFMITKQ